MEDALISPEGFMILSGAGLIEADATAPIYQHITERVNNDENNIKLSEDTTGNLMVRISKKPHAPYSSSASKDTTKDGNYAWVMLVKDDEIISEPYIPVLDESITGSDEKGYWLTIKAHDCYDSEKESDMYTPDGKETKLGDFDSVIVDYYTTRTEGAKQIEITPDKFGGNYYLEASTLFRAQNGVDMPAEFIIPNCKIQSNFTFTMASSGDPSTFTFTIDAFPDYTRFDRSKKVLAAIQIIEDNDLGVEDIRTATVHTVK